MIATCPVCRDGRTTARIYGAFTGARGRHNAAGRRCDRMTRGTLRIYLGAAPGVGKTYAMLDEGNRRRDRGTDVLIGFVEAHGRANTTARIGALPIAPRQPVTYRGAAFDEMDLAAVLARKPE